MNVAHIYSDLQELTDKPFDAQTFVFRLLEIYDAPKATITKLRQGTSNYADRSGDLLWKNKLFFRVASDPVSNTFDAMAADPLVSRHHPRFIFATDGTHVFCRDQKTEQTLENVPIAKLSEDYLLLLPLAGIERYEAPSENVADIKATVRVAKLYDAILEANSDWIERDYTHDLNQFMTRLLFCFFAEDTGIFEKDLFTSTLINHTNEDGSDMAEVIDQIFAAMSLPPENRTNLADYATHFRYVNGGLFRDRSQVPKFSKRARRLLKECGELFWKDINPDIFGSMIQAVAQPGLRVDMGMHYTSVPNIMKVLQPLFLLSLEEEFQLARDSEVRLNRLLQRLYRIRIFDPACGSGNFLIIAYKEMRKLEMRIFERRKEVARQGSLPITELKLSQFFGIELTDFAVETAKLSLWIAEYQMNEVFRSYFGSAPPALPLHESGNIRRGNANQLAWAEVCPFDEQSETYIVGNPPFEGARGQTPAQKADIRTAFGGGDSVDSLDYVCGWFWLAARYITGSSVKAAFVATSSICQGQSVSLFWRRLLATGHEIAFAHLPFKWRNNAAKNAAVSCVVIGIRSQSAAKKFLYDETTSRVVSNISPYLTDTDDIIVDKQFSPPKGLPPLVMGNQAIEGGNLIMSPEDMRELVHLQPEARRFIRPLYGANDLVEGAPRFCIWVSDAEVEEASRIPELRSRFDRVRTYRAGAGEVARSLVDIPYRFRYVHEARELLLVVPRTTTERRDYISCGILDHTAIVTDAVQVIYDPAMYLFSILSSKMHMVWLKAVGGKFKGDPRYSNTLVYNTFPMPTLSHEQQSMLEEHAFAILEQREANPGKTLSWLYDPEKMPAGLLEAHQDLDRAIEMIYLGRPFRNDADRLDHLFKLYIARRRQLEQQKGSKRVRD